MVTGADEPRNPWWDPMGVWRRAGPVFADLTPPGLATPGAWNPLQAIFDGVRSGLVGRPVALGSDENRVGFTLTSLDASVGQMAAATGQVDNVALRASNVTWRYLHFDEVSARLGNFHTRVRSRPVLVAAPIDVSAVLTGEAVDALLANVAPAFRCEITDTGDLRLRRARGPRWVYLQVLPVVEQGALVLRPTGVGRSARPWRLGRRVRPVRPRLKLPDWVRLTNVELRPGSLEVRLRIDEWSFDSADVLSLCRNPQQST